MDFSTKDVIRNDPSTDSSHDDFYNEIMQDLPSPMEELPSPIPMFLDLPLKHVVESQVDSGGEIMKLVMKNASTLSHLEKRISSLSDVVAAIKKEKRSGVKTIQTNVETLKQQVRRVKDGLQLTDKWILEKDRQRDELINLNREDILKYTLGLQNELNEVIKKVKSHEEKLKSLGV